jgi:hypothetical protein
MAEAAMMTEQAATENSPGVHDEELPEWMRYFGVNPEDDEEK